MGVYQLYKISLQENADHLFSIYTKECIHWLIEQTFIKYLLCSGTQMWKTRLTCALKRIHSLVNN